MKRVCVKRVRTRAVPKSHRKVKKSGSIESYATRLRNNMTRAEALFWKALKVRQKYWEYQFLPQKVVHGYIPDFYCEELLLAIEIDGRVHDRKDVKRNDSLRTRRLNRMGVTVIRFRNSEVFGAVHRILSLVEECLTSVQDTKSSITS